MYVRCFVRSFCFCFCFCFLFLLLVCCGLFCFVSCIFLFCAFFVSWVGCACPALDYHPARCQEIEGRKAGTAVGSPPDRRRIWMDGCMNRPWFHIAEYQADDQVRTGCRHLGANRVFEELAPHGHAQGEGEGDKDHPPRIGGIEVGSE